MQKITAFLWFNGRAEEAIEFYTSTFKNSKIISKSTGPYGNLLSGKIELEGQEYYISNWPSQFEFTEAISFMINCETQQEVDDLWYKLIANGGEESMCGWLKDKFGLSWQVTPTILLKYMGDKDKEKANRVMQAMMKMRKIDISLIEKAYADE